MSYSMRAFTIVHLKLWRAVHAYFSSIVNPSPASTVPATALSCHDGEL